MEKSIKIKAKYNSLEKLNDFIKTVTDYESKIDYDNWEVRTDSNGQMEKCIVLQKSGMHAIKAFFENEDTIKLTYIIPNKMMNAYFGKNEKQYKNVLEIVTGKIKGVLLEGAQKKAFNELEEIIIKAA